MRFELAQFIKLAEGHKNRAMNVPTEPHNTRMSFRKIIELSARYLLGGVFVYASIDKIMYPSAFAKVIMNHHIMGNRPSEVIALVLPLVELILGCFLIVGIRIRESSIALSSMLLIFMTVSLRSTIKGFVTDCGCFPKNSILSTSDIYFLLARDASFLLLGILLVASKKLKETQ